MTLILGHDDVLAALPPDACADAMASVLAAHARGEALMPLRSVIPFEGAAGFMATMPAWRGGDEPLFALKSICIIPGNPARGLDTHQGTVTLFDGETGAPTAILDASALTSVRTAAVSAVATRVLARSDARVLAILGAGVQGRSHLAALPGVRDFEEVRVYSPSSERARALADGRATVAASAEDAVRGADVVVRCLEREGVDTVFAYPGGASMELHQALTRPTVRTNRCVAPPSGTRPMREKACRK